MASIGCLKYASGLARSTRCCLVRARRYSQTAASTAGDDLLVERLAGERHGITVFALNRPAAKNAFSRSLVDSLLRGVRDVEADSATRVLILRSNVPGVFCAGADLKERLAMPADEVRAFVSRLRRTMCDVERLPFPVIAALDGAALGGGLELALACDARVAARQARLGLVETRLAIIPGAGGTQRLPRLVGAARAKELIFAARVFDGAEALRLGVVNHAVEQNDEGDAAYLRALQLAEEMLPNGPIALKMAKRAVDEGAQVPLALAYEVEERCYRGVIDTKDRLEGLRAFGEKRKPRYTGQ